MGAIDKEHEYVKMALRLRGSSLSKVAQDLGVSAAAVTYVSKGVSSSNRIEKHIAQLLGVECSAIWPSRYQSGEVSER
jgi:Ner family transcriptional regulator